jgi:lipid II:glycine glycyltransferase (peptidoglycan interpeptide bridge formation enzyme)
VKALLAPTLAQPEKSSTTLFSSGPFIKAWASGVGGGWYPISVSVGEEAPRNVMHGVATRGRWGQISGQFGPAGLYANLSPFPEHCEERIRETIREFQRQRFLSVTWNVRFDHSMLATALHNAGLPSQSGTTHVLPLLEKHEVLFSRYRQTRRNEIRQCYRKGVQVRRALGYEDAVAYSKVHERLTQHKEGFESKYPTSLICELVKLRDHVILLLAEYEGKIIAGALFFWDGDSMMYWHGASDRDYTRCFASGALVDRGIQIACEKGFHTFNLGRSGTDSLRQFKASFGAEARTVYAFAIALSGPLPFRIAAKVRRWFRVS